MQTKQPRQSRGPVLLPLALVALGVLLLLDNFLLLNDFNVTGLLPLLLVILGAQVLLKGDIIPGGEARPFGITRGSVESGTLEISAGDIDIELRTLEKEGRLIVGQFAPDSRPQLNVVETHAHLNLNRANTPWWALNDWQMALAQDLPWQIYISTSLGQVSADLSGVIVENTLIATGIGDIRAVCPLEAFHPLTLRSTLGNIHFITPEGYATRITVQAGRMFGVRFDETRYRLSAPGVYESLNATEDHPPIEIHIVGVFGDAYLA